ncbi:DUF6461 domain-containing protein [Streptomyces sp. NPDC059442]|uniref:DUF6461 domain-containing protein n=1 Tax=Streptomyces sp. NPDC059442 TaxID=3346830 RepID=UPI00367876F1
MTSTETGRGLDFLRGDIPFYTLTFAKGLPPEELLRRMGVDPDTLAPRDAADLDDEFGDTLLDEDEPVVTARMDGAWTWAWERGGTHGTDERILAAVSRGTEAVSLYSDGKPVHRLLHAVDGEVVIGLHSLLLDEPTGSDPHRLDDRLRPLGLLPGHHAGPAVHAMLTLAEEAFGLRVTPPCDDERYWSGSLLPLPHQA